MPVTCDNNRNQFLLEHKDAVEYGENIFMQCSEYVLFPWRDHA